MKAHFVLPKPILLFLVSSGISVSLHADCSGPPALEAKVRAHPDAASYVALGTWFGDKRQFECAMQSFHAALALDPNSPRILYMYGLSLYAAGHADEAIDPLQKSLKAAPDVLQPHLILGAALAQLQRHEDAKAEWEAALKIDSNSTVALDGLSKTLIAEGDTVSVIGLLRSAPSDENLALDLAQAYGKEGMFEESGRTLRGALRVHPSSWRLTNALVTVLVNQSHLQEAKKLAGAFVQAHPRNTEAQKVYLRVLVVTTDNEHAKPLARKLLIAFPHDFDPLYLNGVLENGAGQFAAARKHLSEAIAINPNHYNARYNLGLALAEFKDFAGAREQFQKAIELGGTEPEIRGKYANVLHSLGETEQAQEQLKIYQEQMHGLTSRKLAKNKAAQADKELENGDSQKAVALYHEAVEATPNDALLNFKLGLALDRVGDTVAERDALEKAIAINPDMAIAHNQLGYLASHAGDVPAAEEHFRKAVQAAPAYREAWVSLAATLGMESRFPEAQEAIGNALKLDPNNTEALQLRNDLTAAQAKQ